MTTEFEKRLYLLEEAHRQLINKPNEIAGLAMAFSTVIKTRY